MDYKIAVNSLTVRCIVLLCMLFFSTLSFSQNSLQTKKITTTYASDKLRKISNSLERDYQENSKIILDLAKKNSWKMAETLADGRYISLEDIGTDGTPLYYTTYGDYVSGVSRANTLYKDGILGLNVAGEGMNVGVWDAGTALASHQEFNSRVEITDASTKTDSHSTMVTGTMVASGIDKKAMGVAYKATAVSNNWAKDKIEVAAAAANGLLLSNHSYGIITDRVPDWYFGAYIKVSQDWDNIMYNAPYYLMVTAAGNAQKLQDNEDPIYGKTTDGFDLMLGFTTSKNAMVVSAVDTKIDLKGKLTQAKITPYSSFGPVDDGRIKPDISGGGNSIYAPTSAGNKTYGSATGTSMATPGITASMLLLQQYYEELNGSFMRAATLKGLVLHSADDVNTPGPDYKLGWGVMNTKRAAEIITNNEFTTLVSEEEITTDQSYSFTVNAVEGQPLMASISWTDPAANNINKGSLNDTSAALVNDLDIRITKKGETYFPWKLNAAKASAAAFKGDNTVDPFEKIEIPNATGEYIITVSYKGNLTNAKQQYSIIVSGIAVTACKTDTPTEIEMIAATETAVTFEWMAIKDAFFEIQYKAEGEEEWQTDYTFENSIILNDLLKETDYIFRLRTTCTANIASEYSEEIYFEFKGENTSLTSELEYETLSLSDEVSFSVYPNPAIEKIKLLGDVSPHAKYQIISATGHTLKQGNALNAEIDVNALASGIYILSVTDLNGSKAAKFVKR